MDNGTLDANRCCPNRFVGRVYNSMGLGLATTAVVAHTTASSPDLLD